MTEMSLWIDVQKKKNEDIYVNKKLDEGIHTNPNIQKGIHIKKILNFYFFYNTNFVFMLIPVVL